MAPPKTIPVIKTAFLNEQVRILSQPLELPAGFESQSNIPSKHIDQAIKELNRIYRHHTKSVYPSLAIADVAQQIDYLYWHAVRPSSIDAHDAPLRKADNLTDDQTILRLTDDLATSEAYQDALTKLRKLADKRRALQQKLDKYRLLQRELSVLKDPQSSVQPQLASRDGALAEELGKSRMIATKLAGKIAGTRRAAADDLDRTSAIKGMLGAVDDEQRLRQALRQGG